MSDKPHLSLPRVAVTLDDGRTLEAQVLNADLLRWDVTAAKHKWPHYNDVRTWHSTFCAWAALRRTGAIPKEWTWEEFSEVHCQQVVGIRANGQAMEDGEEPETVDPTPAVAEPD